MHYQLYRGVGNYPTDYAHYRLNEARSHTRNKSSRSMCCARKQRKTSAKQKQRIIGITLTSTIDYMYYFYIKFAKVTNGLYLKQFPRSATFIVEVIVGWFHWERLVRPFREGSGCKQQDERGWRWARSLAVRTSLYEHDLFLIWGFLDIILYQFRRSGHSYALCI